MVGQALGELWGSSVIIENRPGAGNTIATAAAAKATPDGYTLLASSTATVINPYTEKNPGFGHDSFVPIARIAQSPNLIVVPASLHVPDRRKLRQARRAHARRRFPAAGDGRHRRPRL